MNETDARRIADKFAQKFAFASKLHLSASSQPLTLLDILRAGFFIASSLREVYPDIQDCFQFPGREFLATLFASPVNERAVQEFLYQRLINSNEDVVALEADIDAFPDWKLNQLVRKEMQEVIDSIVPASGKPGPLQKITADEFPVFCERCEAIRPMLEEALRLKQTFPQKEIGEIVEFAGSKFPRENIYLARRVLKLEKFMAESEAFKEAKTVKGKARILADLIVGADYGLTETYALQKAEEARRKILGKQRKRSTRLPNVPAEALSELGNKS